MRSWSACCGEVTAMICQQQTEAQVLLDGDVLWLKFCAEQKMQTGMVYGFASVVTDFVYTVI
jgi:hypothetical protein